MSRFLHPYDVFLNPKNIARGGQEESGSTSTAAHENASMRGSERPKLQREMPIRHIYLDDCLEASSNGDEQADIVGPLIACASCLALQELQKVLVDCVGKRGA